LREIELALPLELTREQDISLARDCVKKHFVDAGMCADVWSTTKVTVMLRLHEEAKP